MAQDIAKDNFKADLYYRISQNVVVIPALRDRKEDIAPLVSYFTRKWSEENAEEKHFLADTIPLLEQYSWPGNARELENVVYSALNTSLKSLIGPDDLGERFKAQSRAAGAGTTHPLRAYVDGVERQHILDIAGVSPTLRETATKLELSPQALLRLCAKHGLNSREIVGARLKTKKGNLKNEA